MSESDACSFSLQERGWGAAEGRTRTIRKYLAKQLNLKKKNQTTTKECGAPKMCSEHLAFSELSLKGSAGTGSLFLAGLAPG